MLPAFFEMMVPAQGIGRRAIGLNRHQLPVLTGIYVPAQSQAMAAYRGTLWTLTIAVSPSPLSPDYYHRRSAHPTHRMESLDLNTFECIIEWFCTECGPHRPLYECSFIDARLVSRSRGGSGGLHAYPRGPVPGAVADLPCKSARPVPDARKGRGVWGGHWEC